MDNRAFQRVPFHVEAVIEHADGRCIAEVNDLSVHGVFLETDEAQERFEQGQDVEVTFWLDRDRPELCVRGTAVVMRVEDGGIGVEFVDTSIESFDLLRRIVSQNTGQPELVLAEMEKYLARGGRS
jgi:hypothetical protein